MMLAGIVSAAWAQVDDVTLVVSGEGATKDEATTKALRSAIEQAFGVFVSANTEILNDELVKDEIATVSSGNIKSYTELGTIIKANGNTEVSLQATVSVKKLTTYAKSRGSSCEFAGATFAANMKLAKLNKENTKKAFENLYKQIEAIGDELYTCNINVKNIKQDGNVEITISYYTNENAVLLGELIKSTLQALSIPNKIVQVLEQQGVKIYPTNLVYGKKNTYLCKTEQLYFYYPLNLPMIRGRLLDVYDNLGNKYEVCMREPKEITQKPKRQSAMDAFMNGGNQEESAKPCSLSLEEWFFDPSRNYISKKWENYKQVYSVVGNLIKQNEGFNDAPNGRYGLSGICIPQAYVDCQSKQSKKHNKFEPQHLFTVDAWIKIPPERINQVSNLYMK